MLELIEHCPDRWPDDWTFKDDVRAEQAPDDLRPELSWLYQKGLLDLSPSRAVKKFECNLIVFRRNGSWGWMLPG
jgi:hypothetical protein